MNMKFIQPFATWLRSFFTGVSHPLLVPEIIDKSSWGDGPWMQEPDVKVWRTASGYTGCVARVPNLGHLCGYVSVPWFHPAFGRDYDDVDVRVHGGLTFASSLVFIRADGIPQGKRWWLGFDAAHCEDLTPALDALLRRFKEECDIHIPSFFEAHKVYRDMAYMTTEVEDLATQLKQLTWFSSWAHVFGRRVNSLYRSIYRAKDFVRCDLGRLRGRDGEQEWNRRNQFKRLTSNLTGKRYGHRRLFSANFALFFAAIINFFCAGYQWHLYQHTGNRFSVVCSIANLCMACFCVMQTSRRLRLI